MSDQVADVLDDAADLLEREGWTQWAQVSPEGICAGHALRQASIPTYVLAHPARQSFTSHIGVGYWDLTAWNDAPERTKQQVLDAFRAAAKAERMPPETPAPPGTPDPCGAGVGLPGDAPMSG
jgi:hypothetical protein